MRKSFTFLIALLVANTTAFAFSGSGSGTVASPYLVTSASQLNGVRSDFTAFCMHTREVSLNNVSMPFTSSDVDVATVTFKKSDNMYTQNCKQSKKNVQNH